MVNWKKVFEEDPIFNIILKKLADEYPDEDIKIELEVNNSAKEISLRFKPGHEWLIGYKKRYFGVPELTWKFRLKRPSMTTLIGGYHQRWTISTTVLSRVYWNEWGKNKDKIVTMYWL